MQMSKKKKVLVYTAVYLVVGVLWVLFIKLVLWYADISYHWI